MLPSIISTNQGAFVAGEQIIDEFLIAAYKAKTTGFVIEGSALKLIFEKSVMVWAGIP